MLPPARGPRSSMAPPPRVSRPSISGTINGSAKASSQTKASSLYSDSLNRPSMQPSARGLYGSISGESQQEDSDGVELSTEESGQEALSPHVSDPQDDTLRELPEAPSQSSSLIHNAPGERPTSSRGRSPTSTARRPSATSATAGVSREIEDLKIKLKIIEEKRTEDKEKLRVLDKVQADRDRFEGIIQKLQSKLQPQQQEIVDLKKQLKQEEAKYQTIEAQLAENDSINEMATLDREVAEETAEVLKIDLDTLKRKTEELQLEVEILREENEELGREMSPEEKTSQGWLQMEKTNERLREALIRLRDMTQEEEASLKSQISGLEREAQELDKLKIDHNKTQEELLQANDIVEELRQQLDTALGAEEMIEELTDRNMALNEKVNEMKTAIEDLELLKELNDELDLNHTANEKQMLREIDYNESLLAEEARKSAIQVGTIQDLEYTLGRFRELAKNMQSDLEGMRASKQNSEAEASELSSRSREMMDLNMRLQISASKAQVRAIDLELGKMKAQESSEHLAIVELFLPESFKGESDSIEALLRFRRIGFKARMMHQFVKEQMEDPKVSGQEDDMFIFCDVLDKLVWVSSTCDRFVNSIGTCNLEVFRRLGGAAYELEPVERALNVWVEALKRNELKGEKCASELQRSIALMSHLAELHISEDLEHYADDVHMRAVIMQSHLESAATALSYIKKMTETHIPQPSNESEEEVVNYEDYLHKMELMISQTRSAKMISSKVIRQLEDLQSRSLTLEPLTMNTIESSQNLISDFASSVRIAGSSITKVLTDEARSEPVKYEELELLAQTSFASIAAKVQAATTTIQSFHSLTSSLAQTVEFPSPPPPPPWKVLAQNIRSATTEMAARGMELGRLKGAVLEKNTALAMKEKEADEMSVKIEVLEKRVGDSGGRREQFREMEAVVEAAQSKEKEFISRVNQLQIELHTLEAERETWKEAPQLSPTSQIKGSATTSQASLRQIAALEAEIKALQSSIRYLRSASHAQALSKAHSFLSSPIAPKDPEPPAIQAEAKDVLKEMLNLVSQSETQVVKLQPRSKADRLRWQPLKETSTWRVQKLRDDWEEWSEWRDGVAKKAINGRREEERRTEARKQYELGKEREPLATVQTQLPAKLGALRQVKIAKPGEWEESK